MVLIMKTLEQIYTDLKDPQQYNQAIKKRIAKIILGASVIRAFEENTKPVLFKCLLSLDVDEVVNLRTEVEYDDWHKRQIAIVFDALLINNREKYGNHLEGLKWGHATKVFNLFIGHLYHYSPYFEKEKQTGTVHSFLHIPLDSKVFAVLNKCDIDVPKTIKTVSENKYLAIQTQLRKAAQKTGVDPLRFDDYAWADDDN